MMDELRRLLCLLDTNNIILRVPYIRSSANVWADKLSRHLDIDVWKLDPAVFPQLDARFGRNSIDCFASALNIILYRYNAEWEDPTCEAVNAPHLSDSDWRKENNWCNPPWPLLQNIVQKLRQSGAAITVIAPIQTGKVWHHALTEMASEQ
jgi:hypothetical protein